MSCVGTCASSSFSNEFLTSYLKMWSKNYGDRYIQNSSDHTKANYCFIIHSKWLLVKKKNSQNNFTSIHVKVLSSVACFSASSGDKGMFSSTDILQIVNVLHRVVFLLFLLPWNKWNFASFCTDLRRQRNLVPRSFGCHFPLRRTPFGPY